MNQPKSPAEIARETLKRLAASHLPPTPENFQTCYNEIANVPSKAPFPEQQLRHLTAALPVRHELQKEQLAGLDAAIARHSWQGVERALTAYLDVIEATPAKGAAGQATVPALPTEFTERLARYIESALTYLGDGKELAAETAEILIQALRNSPNDFLLLQDLLTNLGHQTRVSGEEQAHIRNSLLKLLHLIIENIGELVLDESWLKGQIDGLLAVIEPPITMRQLDEMERRLREVIAKQGEIKRQSIEAQKEMRTMLAAFVASLAAMNKSSTTFQSTIEESARKIENVKKIEELTPLLREVIAATHSMAEETSHTRDQLKGMQEKVESTEAALVRLYEELDNASAQARHDPLTDALNRKGLDDALAREIASIRRRKVPLSICLLDIDNFKKLNDRLGHEAGDQALIHLASIARQCVRPNDTLARYGGEEFIILMPDTRLDDGIEAMVRLQRELTKKFFLSEAEKILITFSAGVAQLGTDEAGIEAIKRADKAMYQAKRAGKNRVIGG
ncbi:MAG: GGDEF domain-containing protein [Rhodocyclaceae bacterium]|nr:MAG: GGDEF domain-containing protein [Rhodocyclaceae bacterium]